MAETRSQARTASEPPDATGSGRRIIRNPLRRPERSGEDRDGKRDLQRERSNVGVDADDLVLDRLRLTGELLLEPGVAHHLRVVLERVSDLFLGGSREHGAVLGLLGECDRERCQHDRSGERESERQPEGSRRLS